MVDELWQNTRFTYKEHLGPLKKDIESLKFDAERFQVTADTMKHGYPLISKREQGRSYEAQVEYHCLCARLCQLTGKPEEVEGHLKQAREYQNKLEQLTQSKK